MRSVPQGIYDQERQTENVRESVQRKTPQGQKEVDLSVQETASRGLVQNRVEHKAHSKKDMIEVMTYEILCLALVQQEKDSTITVVWGPYAATLWNYPENNSVRVGLLHHPSRRGYCRFVPHNKIKSPIAEHLARLEVSDIFDLIDGEEERFTISPE